MKSYGLIGYPLGHSFSKKYFSEKFEREGIQDARYELFPLENIAELPQLVAQNPTLRGLNVTIPHKESVLPFLHSLHDTARAIGAVNCIHIVGKQLLGYNTDAIGFEHSLLSLEHKNWKHGPALILGTGGASKAVAYVLNKLEVPFQFVSRNPRGANEISYEAMVNAQASLVVNATPIGTFPKVEEMPPVPPDFFNPAMMVYDLTYNPAETLLLRVAKARGCSVKNGLEMLELQAEAAWEVWKNGS